MRLSCSVSGQSPLTSDFIVVGAASSTRCGRCVLLNQVRPVMGSSYYRCARVVVIVLFNRHFIDRLMVPGPWRHPDGRVLDRPQWKNRAPAR